MTDGGGARFTRASDACAYILGGHAIVTLVSRKTGARFTYRIKAPAEGDNIRFVAVLMGPDNGADYVYLGQIYTRDRYYMRGRKSTIDAAAPSAMAFAWSWFHLRDGKLPEDLEVWHEGTCGRCGRRLTTPESIAKGMGPECARRSAP
jgi:hypothetical protein